MQKMSQTGDDLIFSDGARSFGSIQFPPVVYR